MKGITSRMTSAPLILIAADCSNQALTIIRDIMDNKNCPTPVMEDGIEKYDWEIQNKYYDASLKICQIQNEKQLTNTMSNSTEAIIIYILGTVNVEALEKWKNVISQCEPEICIVLSEQIEPARKPEIVTWCLRHKFELIEKNAEKQDEDDYSVMAETQGIARVIEALHAHTWSNYRSKPYNTEQSNGKSNSYYNHYEEDEDGLEYIDNFSKLFAQLKSTSENAKNLSPCERKQYAEEVVTAFWKAIGGDESELEDTLD